MWRGNLAISLGDTFAPVPTRELEVNLEVFYLVHFEIMQNAVPGNDVLSKPLPPWEWSHPCLYGETGDFHLCRGWFSGSAFHFVGST